MYFLKQESDVFDELKKFKAMVVKQSGRSIRFLRIDNGVKFCSRSFANFCNQEGTQRQYTTSYTL